MPDLEGKGNAMLRTSRDYFPIEAPTKRAENVRDRRRTRRKESEELGQG